MPVWRTLLALLLCASVGWSAELRTLKGKVYKGDLVQVTDKEIVLQDGAEKASVGLTRVFSLRLGEGGRVTPGVSYSDVRLSDGSLFHCKTFTLVDEQVTLELLSGQSIKIPLKGVASVLFKAESEKNRTEWAKRLEKKRRRDVLARVIGGVVNGIEGTLGSGDAKGETIRFTVTIGTERLSRRFKLNALHGLIFSRGVDPNAAPVVCKIEDRFANQIQASRAITTPEGFLIKTPSGAQLTYKQDQLALLDYSKEKLTYLSDLEPVGQVLKGGLGLAKANPRFDKSFTGGPIQIDGTQYDRGLGLRPHTELVFDLKGDYREFRAIVGVDDQIKFFDDRNPITLRIEGDGKQLYSGEFKPTEEKRARVVALNIKDVEKLRIVVTSTGFAHFKKHLNLADVKVSK